MIEDPNQLTKDLSKHCKDKIKRALFESIDLLDDRNQGVWLAVDALDLIFDFACASIMVAYEADTGNKPPPEAQVATFLIKRAIKRSVGEKKKEQSR